MPSERAGTGRPKKAANRIPDSPSRAAGVPRPEPKGRRGPLQAPRIDAEVRDAFRLEYASGATLEEIAERSGAPLSRVRQWCYRYGWDASRNLAADKALGKRHRAASEAMRATAFAASQAAAPQPDASQGGIEWRAVTSAAEVIAYHAAAHRGHLLALMQHAREHALLADKHAEVSAWSALVVTLIETDRRHLAMLDPERAADRYHALDLAKAKGASAIQEARALAVAQAVPVETETDLDGGLDAALAAVEAAST